MKRKRWWWWLEVNPPVLSSQTWKRKMIFYVFTASCVDHVCDCRGMQQQQWWSNMQGWIHHVLYAHVVFNDSFTIPHVYYRKLMYRISFTVVSFVTLCPAEEYILTSSGSSYYHIIFKVYSLTRNWENIIIIITWVPGISCLQTTDTLASPEGCLHAHGRVKNKVLRPTLILILQLNPWE